MSGDSADLAREVILVEEPGAGALWHGRLPEGANPVVARSGGRTPPPRDDR